MYKSPAPSPADGETEAQAGIVNQRYSWAGAWDSDTWEIGNLGKNEGTVLAQKQGQVLA